MFKVIHYCLQIYFRKFRSRCIEIDELDLDHYLSAPGVAWKSFLEKTGLKLESLTNNNMLMMIEKRVRGGI